MENIVCCWCIPIRLSETSAVHILEFMCGPWLFYEHISCHCLAPWLMNVSIVSMWAMIILWTHFRSLIGAICWWILVFYPCGLMMNAFQVIDWRHGWWMLVFYPCGLMMNAFQVVDWRHGWWMLVFYPCGLMNTFQVIAWRNMLMNLSILSVWAYDEHISGHWLAPWLMNLSILSVWFSHFGCIKYV